MIELALVWWFALGIQLLAIPGSLLPVLPACCPWVEFVLITTVLITTVLRA